MADQLSELLPYYEQAERMLHAVGTKDPLSAYEANHLGEPPPLGPADSEILSFFQRCGMHPYSSTSAFGTFQAAMNALGKLCVQGLPRRCSFRSG